MGRWKIIGNYISNLKDVIMPYYKLGFPPDVKLVNYRLDVIRMATPEEDELLNFQHSMSPIGYQKELQAYYNLIEWKSDIKYNYKQMVDLLIKLKLLPTEV